MSLYQHDRAKLFRFELRGELKADLAQELERCWETAASTFGSRTVVIDITGVTGLDDSGLRTLAAMQARGAKVETRGADTTILERINRFNLANDASQVA